MTALSTAVDDRGVATVVVDHPPINLITMEVFFELGTEIERLAHDASVRAVVFRSANPEWFLAHFDVEAIQQFPREQPEPTAIGPYDQMIAGHARSQGLILVTNNEREFNRVPGLRIENWV